MSDVALLEDDQDISIEELVELCAIDHELFCRTFFPNTVRQPFAPFHLDLWKVLESNARFVNIQVFRDGGKTSTCRMYTAKRIAYGLAHTILYLGKSEGHAARSINWLRRQISYNPKFAKVFGLKAGDKWQDVEAEIRHETDEYPIWIMGMGITGSVRGINRDDFRPDLIVLDDVLDRETSATPEQRQKVNDLVYGDIMRSLAPASETPDAKLVALQTPQNKEDFSTKALDDPRWKSIVFPCWTARTIDEPIDKQESAWPARYPSEVLRKDKKDEISQNRASTWMREMECKLISPETSSFRVDWLKYWDLLPEPMTCVMVIDPVPPPSDIQIAKGLKGKDFEAFAVVGRHHGNFYLMDYTLNRGHDPSWTIAEFFRLALKHRPRRVLVEATAYQRTLAWLLREAMRHQRRYFVIHEYDDRRKKYDRIVDGLNGPAANGHLFVSRNHHEFISQFEAYPDVPNDDLIEAVAVGVADLHRGIDVIDTSEAEDTYKALVRRQGPEERELDYMRGAP